MEVPMNKVSLVSLLMLALLVSGVAVFGQDAPLSYPELNGDWASVSCEQRPPADQPTYLKREITFQDGEIAIVFHQFADAACTEPTFSFYFGGSYEILGDSTVAEGAKEANITITDVRITPDSDGFAGFLNSAETGTCGAEAWEVGTQQAVSETGCSVLGLPAGLVTTEYEIFYVLNDFMFFGARPLDGSFLSEPEKRPTALLVPVMKAE
jgi:hypothetical protein